MSDKMSSSPLQAPEPYPGPHGDLLTQTPPIATYGPRKSVTMEEDKSQPPTPDGTGLPVNFAQVGPGIYRSSYPQAAHFCALQPLRLKTIITLLPGEVLPDYKSFMRTGRIAHHQIQILANKDPEVYTSDEVVNKVLKLILDPTNHPILVHCNKGKHRTGCIMACFRKVTGWSLDAYLAEYEKYSKPKSRELDKVFITRFDASTLKPLALERGFVGGAFSQQYTGSSKDSEYTAYTYTSDDSLLTELDLKRRRESMHRGVAGEFSTDDSRDVFEDMEAEF
jgi:protein tyrosine/serine phosphatase